MRYREYRRKCKETKKDRAKKIASFSSVCGYFCRKKEVPGCGQFYKYADADDADYLVHKGRGRRSSYLKKEYARKLRRSSKLNMIAYNHSSYKKASGDFWWDYD